MLETDKEQCEEWVREAQDGYWEACDYPSKDETGMLAHDAGEAHRMDRWGRRMLGVVLECHNAEVTVTVGDLLELIGAEAAGPCSHQELFAYVRKILGED